MFRLSNYISVEVKISQYAAEGFLQIKRHRDYDHWINVSASSWKKMTLVMQDIDKAISDRQERAFDLYRTKDRSQKVLVSLFNEDLFVGIHLFDKNGQRERGKGLNFNMTEWQKLKELTANITAAMKTQIFPASWTYADVKRPIYRSMMKTFKGQLIYEGAWNFTQPELQKPDRAAYFMIQEREVMLPSASDLLVICYAYLIDKAIKPLIQCGGCTYDHPSQVQHLEGCMLSTDEAWDRYALEAKANLSIDEVLKLYRVVREELDLPPPEGTFDVETYLKKVDVKSEIDDLYKRLCDELSPPRFECDC